MSVILLCSFVWFSRFAVLCCLIESAVCFRDFLICTVIRCQNYFVTNSSCFCWMCTPCSFCCCCKTVCNVFVAEYCLTRVGVPFPFSWLADRMKRKSSFVSEFLPCFRFLSYAALLSVCRVGWTLQRSWDLYASAYLFCLQNGSSLADCLQN